MEKELFFLFNPDNFEATKKPVKSYRTPPPSTFTMPEKLRTYLRIRSAITKKLFSY